MDAQIDKLIELHADRAYAIALKMAGNPADAGDIVQEAFLRAMKYMKSYDATYPFEATLTIGPNRAIKSADPSQPGAHPLCKQRIVSPIQVDFTPHAGGRLLVRVDPRGLFTNVDFTALEKASDAPLLYRFRDETVGQPSVSLYEGLRARSGAYDLSWIDPSEADHAK